MNPPGLAGGSGNLKGKGESMKELDKGTVFYFAYYPDDSVEAYDSDTCREIAINNYLEKVGAGADEWGFDEVTTQEFYLADLCAEDRGFERAALKEIGINVGEDSEGVANA